MLSFVTVASSARTSDRIARSFDVVIDWNTAVTQHFECLAASDMSTLAEVRVCAIAHLAMHHAVRAAMQPDQAEVPSPATVPEVAAAVAMHTALTHLLHGSRDEIDRLLDTQLNFVPEGPAKTRAMVLGRESAVKTLARFSTGDNVSARIPLALKNARQFRADPPYIVDEGGCRPSFGAPNAYDAVLRRSGPDDAGRLVRFWSERPVLRWNRVARSLSLSAKSDLPTTAHLFATINVAMADACLAAAESQAHFAARRSVFVRAGAVAMTTAALDNEPSSFDPRGAQPPDVEVGKRGTGQGLVEVHLPPLTGYPARAAAMCGAAAAVLDDALPRRTREITVDSKPDGASSDSRQFRNVTEAARECALARVLTGEHFREAAIAGFEQGRRVAGWVVRHAPFDESR